VKHQGVPADDHDDRGRPVLMRFFLGADATHVLWLYVVAERPALVSSAKTGSGPSRG
jgi:hypothetical protein